jgi:hypothetical protein
MAGDWIKMRESLHEDPAVVEIAHRLGTRPEHVVGYCHRFWSWASRNSHDGSVTGVTLEALGAVLSLPQFPEMLVDAGWLEYDESGPKPIITIPKFDRHLSQGAKARGLAAERARHARVTISSRSKRNKSAPEKRREDKSISLPTEEKPPTPLKLPDVLDVQSFRDAFDVWLAYKKERRESYKPSGLSGVINSAADKAKRFGVQAVIEAMQTARANGWKGWDQKSFFGATNGKPRRTPTAGDQYDPSTAGGPIEGW